MQSAGITRRWIQIASLITQEQVEREPLKYQLKTPFQNLSDGEQLKVVKKAKDCLHVCNVIAPGNGEELFDRVNDVCTKRII